MSKIFIWKQPTVVPPSTVSRPDGYDTFIAKFNARKQSMGEYWNTTNPNAFNAEREQWLGWWKASDHFNDPGVLAGYALKAGDGWENGYLVPNNYGLPGYYIYTDGFSEEWVRTGNVQARDSVIEQSLKGSYSANTTPMAWVASESRSREIAYVALAYMNAEVRCGAAHRDRLNELMDLAFGDVGQVVDGTRYGSTSETLTSGGYIEQWLSDYAVDSSGGYVSGNHAFASATAGFGPFMAAYTSWTGIRFNLWATSTGSHNSGASNVLTDNNARWVKNAYVGRTVENITDGSTGTVISNTATTMNLVLSGGTNNTWSPSDQYRIVGLLNNGSVQQDSRVLPKIQRIFDAAYNEMWITADESHIYRWGGTNGAPDLNTIIFPIYAWLYLQTGENRYKVRANELFLGSRNSYGAVNHSNPTVAPKQWNDYIRYTFDGLDWYDQATALHG